MCNQKFGILLLALVFTGCTSLRTYGPNQLNASLPIRPGDEVTVYLDNTRLDVRPLVVTSIAAASISGKPDMHTGEIETHRWENIRRIEHRQHDSAKTTTLSVLGVLLILGAIEVGESIGDGLSNLFGGEED